MHKRKPIFVHNFCYIEVCADEYTRESDYVIIVYATDYPALVVLLV